MNAARVVWTIESGRFPQTLIAVFKKFELIALIISRFWEAITIINIITAWSAFAKRMHDIRWLYFVNPVLVIGNWKGFDYRSDWI